MRIVCATVRRAACLAWVLLGMLAYSCSSDPSDADDSSSRDQDATPTHDCREVARGDVVISKPSGTFQSQISVELSTHVSNAEIRFTTNGDPPGSNSQLYQGTALNFRATTRLRAQAFVAGFPSGAESAALFVARDSDATHDLPLVVLDSYGSGKLATDSAQRVFVDVAYLGFDLNGGTTSLSAQPSVASFAAFHVRGQSSAMFPKVPYRVELRTGTGGDRDCPAFGMPDESDWALVGPYADKTLVHNAFVYELGRELGLMAPRLRFIELYVNLEDRPLQKDDYQGVYQLVETIKNQKDRLDLRQLDDQDTSLPTISGGYIFKFEWRAAEEPLLACPSGTANCWRDLEIVSPNPINQPQRDFLTQYLVSFNEALHSAQSADASSGYPFYIDVPSFVDHVILNEFTRNMDAFVRSQYFHKDREGKLLAGPLWDFDLIAGVGMTAGGFGGVSFANTAAEGWQYEANASRLNGATSDWFPQLIVEPAFAAQLSTRWRELRAGELSDAGIDARVDAAAKGLSNAAQRNFAKWNILTRQTVTPFATPTEASWEGQLSYMKTWLKARAAWFDTQWK